LVGNDTETNIALGNRIVLWRPEAHNIVMKRLNQLSKSSLLILLFLFATASSAREKRYFGIDDKPIKEYFSSKNSADLFLQGKGIDFIDIGNGELNDASWPQTYFSRAQLKSFFQEEKHKDKLLVWIDSLGSEDRSICWQCGRADSYAKNFGERIGQIIVYDSKNVPTKMRWWCPHCKRAWKAEVPWIDDPPNFMDRLSRHDWPWAGRIELQIFVENGRLNE
jgi:hypothetical protein